MGYAEVECPADDCPACFEIVNVAEVVPQAQ
jgi:hypothetical protein